MQALMHVLGVTLEPEREVIWVLRMSGVEGLNKLKLPSARAVLRRKEVAPPSAW